MNIYMSDNQLVEYFFGVIGLVTGFIISYNLSLMYEIIIRWSLMWIFRKIAINIYISIKRKYNIKDRRIIILPYPKIIL